MTSREELEEATAQHRRLAADLFDDLSPEELETPTLCPAWTAHAMAAHLVMPLDVSPLRFALEITRHRGSMDRASEAVVARLSSRPIEQLTAVLREKADVHPPIRIVGTAGLRLRATDQDWQRGEGPEVVGPSEALALGLAGRSAAFPDLNGPGLPALRRRLRGHGEQGAAGFGSNR